jgi:flagellar hook-associated protein 1
MAGPFLGINMSSQALRNYQRSMTTIGNNIANVNTRGYSRQTVEFSPLPQLQFYSGNWKSVGQGSIISSVNRVRADYLEASQNNASSQFGKSDTVATHLQRIEGIYGEPSDSGISQALDRFFNSWSGLGSNPGDTAAQTEVRLSGQVLTDRVRNRYQDLSLLGSSQTAQVSNTIDQINGLAGRIASLNAQIVATVGTDGSANDLMDQRDMAVSDLSSLVNVNRQVFPDGSYAIYAAGHTLVQGDAVRPFPSTFDAATGTVTDGTNTYQVKSGALAGHLAGLNETNTQKSNLDQLANELKTQVNTLHAAGTNGAGDTGINFFDDVLVPPQTGASDFKLSSDVQGDLSKIMTGMTGDAGDGSIAQQLGEMRDTVQATLGGKSFKSYFSDIIGKLASDTNFQVNNAATELSVLDQIEQQQQAVSGVSLDDEMANLVKMQRSYQAAARAMSIFDQVTEDLINLIR